jgi:hypothetical protein
MRMTKKTRYFLAGSAAVLAAGLGTGLVAYYTGGFETVSASPVENELRYVPADATLVAYADVRQIMDSDLRARLKEALPMHEEGQREFQAHTGIDIERDVDYVVASLSSVSGQHPAPLVVARGRFNDTQLETLAREHGGTVEDYKGKRIVVCSSTENGTPVPTQSGSVTLAFLEPGLLAIGDTNAVKTSIDAQLSAHSVTSNNEMMELVHEISEYNNAWAVGRFDLLASQANLPEQVSSRLPPIKWFAAAGHVNGGLSGSLRAEARDDQSAENLRDIVRGFLALARMQAGSDPRVQGLVESLQLTGSGKTVALSFTVPAEVIQLIPKSHQQVEPQVPQPDQK